MLAYKWQAESGIPVVFLHGLLGSQEDWAEVFALLRNFPDIRPLALDLPCHRQSSDVVCHDFSDCRKKIHRTICHVLGKQPFYLVGYSLGGRLALDYALNGNNPLLLGVIVEGANIGLQTAAEKTARWQNDIAWAERFEYEPLDDVLAAWYQQPVFSDLNADKRAEFVQKRQNNDGKLIAHMLRATSLAKQPFFDVLHSDTHVEIAFLIGEYDNKFRRMAEENCLNYRLIPYAGHNAHQANPEAFVTELLYFLRR